ncbi:uncharacterized protein LOC127244006 [Andrographis paniculata]|uniref:uncharacterized protein LOC127244006 n=1 Tax=Andrographis paniculata TaxID=175694 RepID=UPI0021E944C6|nr:uncharacterized protein LOC127244006 [Andrographis paniculata]
MERSGGGDGDARNWSEAVEDLLDAGEVDNAVSLLKSTIANLENELKEEKVSGTEINGKPLSSTSDQLSTALHDLAKLYSSIGFSLEADKLRSRADQIKHGKGKDLSLEKESSFNYYSKGRVPQYDVEQGCEGSSSHLVNDGQKGENSGEDDWEAMADRDPEELLPSQNLPDVSELSVEDSTAQSPKRRGRGTFMYKSRGLYSDSLSDEPVADTDDSESENNLTSRVEDPDKINQICGTSHVLVLTDFLPSTRTTDLEKLLEKFKNRFVIRWVNDRASLAVFKTPSLAREAINSISCPFTVRVLNESDEVLRSIPPKDLEPPRQRPATSVRTAQRLIAQSIGIKLPSNVGSSEARKQEAARKSRIISRQNMRDDAWGGDNKWSQ